MKNVLKYNIFRQSVAIVALLLWLVSSPITVFAADDINSLIRLGKAAVAAERPVDAIRSLNKAYQLTRNHCDPALRCEVCYTMGSAYFVISEYDKALGMFFEAYELCEKNHLEWKRKGKVINAIAGVFFEQGEYERAQDMMKECYSSKEEQRDSVQYVIDLLDMAFIANKQLQFEETARLLRKARRYLPKNAEPYATRIKVVWAECLFLQHKYAELIPMAKEICSGKWAGREDKTTLYAYIVRIYTDQGKLSQAQKAARRGISIAPVKKKPMLYAALSDLYKKQGQYEKALSLKDSVMVYTDSIYHLANRQMIQKNQMRLEIIQYQAAMENKMSRLNAHRMLLLFVTLTCLLILMVCLIVMRNRSAKNRHEKQIMTLKLEKEQANALLAERQMRETELEAEFQKKFMKQHLEEKKRELAATTMFLQSRNDLIVSILDHLKRIMAKKSTSLLSDLVHHLEQLLKSSKEEDKFMKDIVNVAPDFTKLIKEKHPELLDSDIRFLTYIRMNLTVKDIATMLNITPESCRRRKIRVSKKLGLPSSAELYSYIINLS